MTEQKTSEALADRARQAAEERQIERDRQRRERQAQRAASNRVQAMEELRELLGVDDVTVTTVDDTGGFVALDAEGLHFVWRPGTPLGQAKVSGMVYVCVAVGGQEEDDLVGCQP